MLKRVILMIMGFIIATTTVACFNKSLNDSVNNASTVNESISSETIQYKTISPEEAKTRIDSGEDLVILDVRELNEYAEGHIPHSVLLPVNNLENEASTVLKDKEQPIIVYCRSGSRSKVASEILIKQGYNNVYDLGGIINWPYEIAK